MNADLDRRDRAIVNAFQGGFPVVADPFEPAAAALRERDVDLDADDLLERISRMDEAGTLSRFGPLVNADEIGGTATLVATHAPEDEFDDVVAAINDRPEVAHNYAREHPHLNVWFVVSVADADRVDDVLAEIESATGQPTYDLPKLQQFRVEAQFPVDGPLAGDGVDLSDVEPDAEAVAAGTDESLASADTGSLASADAGSPRPSDGQSPSPSDGASPTASDEESAPRDDSLPRADSASADADSLTSDELDLVAAVQDGLPLTRTPYADVAADLDRDPEWVRRTLRRFEREGKVRRIGVVPNHYALGYTENGMTVWDVPDDAVDEVGPAVAALPFVTHCYERPRHEGVWPYNLFAMTHGRSEAESEARIEQVRETVAENADVRQWDTLFSTEILKKTGINVAERAQGDSEEP